MIKLVELLVGPFTRILERVIPDKDKREAMAHELAVAVETQAHQQIMSQLEINKAQAQHGSIFVAGARPAILWICAAALMWNFVLQPLLLWVAWLVPEYTDKIAMAPRLDIGELMWLLTGMLGLGGMRTYERKHGVERNRIHAE